ncbi:MAG TPA: hypothetical protein VI199_07995 [Novosphingobium sp.]
MASVAATPGQTAGYAASQGFFVKVAWILAGIIVFGFAQHAALGRVDIPRVPVWVHLHGLVMLGWLGLFVTQNRLAQQGDLARHRQLGQIGAVLVCAILLLGWFTGVMSLMLHRSPPFFTPSYFLALTTVDSLVFAGLVLSGIARRADTETHRRLITGGTIIILEPAFGRLLPMPLIGGETGEWIVMVIQLGFVAAIALQDRRTLGRVMPATLAVAGVVVAAHGLIALLGHTPAVIHLAGEIRAARGV